MKVISASALIEYLTATPSRRLSILKTAMQPKVFLMDRYGLTYKATTRSLISGDTAFFQGALDILDKHIPKNSSAAQRTASTRESLIKARPLADYLIEQADQYYQPPLVLNHLEFGSLNVKIRPQAVVQGPGNKFGTVKFHCSKGFQLTTESGTNFATLVHLYSETTYQTVGLTDPKYTTIVDVFGSTLFKAPKKFAARRKLLEDACSEISDRWDALAYRLTG